MPASSSDSPPTALEGATQRARKLVLENPWTLLAVLGVISLILAMWGFWIQEDSDVIDGPASARDVSDVLMWLTWLTHWAALFAFEPPPGSSNVQLVVARSLAIAAAVFFAWRGISILSRRQVEERKARKSKSHVIVCGLGRRGIRLVQEFRRKGHRVVAIEHADRVSAIEAGRQHGALVIAGDATDRHVLDRAGVRRARCLISVGPSDVTNVGVATAVMSVMPETFETGRPRPRAIVHVRDEQLVGALRNSPSRASSSYLVEFVNITQRAAWSLLDYPEPLDFLRGAPRLLIAGVGLMSQELIVAGALLASRLSVSPEQGLRVTVVDRHASEYLARLSSLYPELKTCCELEPVDVEPAMLVHERADLFVGSAQPMRVYVCLDDAIAGLSTGVQLYRSIGHRMAVVVAVLSEEESAGRFLTPGGAFDVGPQLFGLIERTCTVELLLDTPVETVARLQHLDYVRDRLAARKKLGDTPFLRPWDELTDAQREENREWARSISAKLAVVSAAVRELVDWELELFEFTDEEVERLAEFEHERWYDWRARNGWRHASKRDDDQKVHPDMVPWDLLGEPSREIDREQIRNMPRQLARAGFEIYRLDADMKDFDTMTPTSVVGLDA